MEFRMTMEIFIFCRIFQRALIHIDIGASMFSESTFPSTLTSMEHTARWKFKFSRRCFPSYFFIYTQCRETFQIIVALIENYIIYYVHFFLYNEPLSRKITTFSLTFVRWKYTNSFALYVMTLLVEVCSYLEDVSSNQNIRSLHKEVANQYSFLNTCLAP